MLKKLSRPMNNSLECVDLMLKGAKKRRIMAHSAVKAVNTELGIRPNLATVK